MLFYIKMISLKKYLKKFEERFFMKKSVTHLNSLLKLLFKILIIAHLFACLWIFVSRLEK